MYSEGVIMQSTSVPDLERQLQQSPSSEKDVIKKEVVTDAADNSSVGGEEKTSSSPFSKHVKPLTLVVTAIVILGWWVSATIIPATRHRWIVQTIFAWVRLYLVSAYSATSFTCILVFYSSHLLPIRS